MKTISILGLLGLGAVGFGGWYKFHTLKPKTLKEYLEWQGFKVGIINDNTWDAILDEHKRVAEKAINKVSIDRNDLRNWCENNLGREDYEDLKEHASKLCTDNLKKVRSKIIQIHGQDRLAKLLKDDQDYKIAYVFRKHIDGFLELIGHNPPSQSEDGEDNDNLDEAKVKFQKWCEGALDKEPDEVLVSNVLTLCTPKKFKTIKELIQQNGGELLTGAENKDELKKKYNEIKELASWKAENSNNLGDWCSNNESKPFSDKDVFIKIYPRFRFRCVKEKK